MIFTMPLLLAFLALALAERIEQPEPVGSPNRLLELAQMKVEAQNLVNAVNSEQSLWKAGLNTRFAYMDFEEKRRMMGARMGGKRLFRKKALVPKSPLANPKNEDLPESFDARDSPVCGDVISLIQDQSVCGSCWAVAAASAMSDRICVKSAGKLKVQISALDLLSCETFSDGCNGGYPDAAWDFWSESGLVSGGNFTVKTGCKPYPFPPVEHPAKGDTYKTPKCRSACQKGYPDKYQKDKHYGKPYYQKELLNENEIRKEIMDNGPVEAAFYVYEDFTHYKEGVYKHVKGRFLGGHAVRVIGWGVEKGTKYWLVANSWNAGWGDNGLFKIIRGTDDCGFESEITFGEPDLDHLNL